MSDDINIKISATDNATATLRAVQAQLTSFSSSIKAIAGTALAGYGLRELGSFLGDSLKAYGESERAVTMLDRVLKSTGNTIKMTRKEIQSYAEARMAQTVFDDDAIVEAASHLARFRDLSGETFKETLDAAQDLATVMGTDLVSATQMLGRALSDPAEGLSKLARAGVLFTDSQKEQIKILDLIGDKAGQQKIILEELRRQFGGAAIDDASTAAGQIKALEVAIGNLKEEIGKTLAGAILPLLNELRGGKGSEKDLLDRTKRQSKSGVDPIANKLRETQLLDQQLGANDDLIREIQRKERQRQQGFFGPDAFAEEQFRHELEIASLRENSRRLMQQREAIAKQASIDAGESAFINSFGSLGRQLFAGAGNTGSAIAGIAPGLGDKMFRDLLPQVAIDIQASGLAKMLGFSPQAEAKKQQQLDRSLAATESRFLTRGRGQLSPGEQKIAEIEQRQLTVLERMERAFANIGESVILVEGI
jgi:hypothetical protein